MQLNAPALQCLQGKSLWSKIQVNSRLRSFVLCALCDSVVLFRKSPGFNYSAIIINRRIESGADGQDDR